MQTFFLWWPQRQYHTHSYLVKVTAEASYVLLFDSEQSMGLHSIFCAFCNSDNDPKYNIIWELKGNISIAILTSTSLSEDTTLNALWTAAHNCNVKWHSRMNMCTVWVWTVLAPAEFQFSWCSGVLWSRVISTCVMRKVEEIRYIEETASDFSFLYHSTQLSFQLHFK
jgi:hypothetical protein